MNFLHNWAWVVMVITHLLLFGIGIIIGRRKEKRRSYNEIYKQYNRTESRVTRSLDKMLAEGDAEFESAEEDDDAEETDPSSTTSQWTGPGRKKR